MIEETVNTEATEEVTEEPQVLPEEVDYHPAPADDLPVEPVDNGRQAIINGAYHQTRVSTYSDLAVEFVGRAVRARITEAAQALGLPSDSPEDVSVQFIQLTPDSRIIVVQGPTSFASFPVQLTLLRGQLRVALDVGNLSFDSGQYSANGA